MYKGVRGFTSNSPVDLFVDPFKGPSKSVIIMNPIKVSILDILYNNPTPVSSLETVFGLTETILYFGYPG